MYLSENFSKTRRPNDNRNQAEIFAGQKIIETVILLPTKLFVDV
jgi:hypothetical protein